MSKKYKILLATETMECNGCDDEIIVGDKYLCAFNRAINPGDPVYLCKHCLADGLEEIKSNNVSEMKQ